MLGLFWYIGASATGRSSRVHRVVSFCLASHTLGKKEGEKMLRHTSCGGLVYIVHGMAICSVCRRCVRAEVSAK